MPVNPEDRTTVALGAGLIRAVRERAEAEGRGFSAVVADAVNAYLARQTATPAPEAIRAAVRAADDDPNAHHAMRPSTGGKSVLATGAGPAAPAGLEAEMRAMLGVLRELVPDVRRVVENHDEAMDTLDQLAAEIGRRQGAALALEEAAAIADGRATGR